MKILVVGDSFASDWQKKYPNLEGWPNFISQKYNVTNLAQSGISEYKIYKQICKINLDDYNLLIINHTSPYRIPTVKHPLYSDDLLHYNSDLIFSDIEYHAKKFINKFNFSLQSAYGFFIHHYDKDYQETTYQLYKEKINSLITIPKIVLDELPDWEEIKIRFKGNCNHLNQTGNKIIFQKLDALIESYLNSLT